MNGKEILLVLAKYNLFYGRQLSMSKSLYRGMYPDNKVWFNASIYKGNKKIWWGDLDITLDSEIQFKDIPRI
jgi:hypothetical protein